MTLALDPARRRVLKQASATRRAPVSRRAGLDAGRDGYLPGDLVLAGPRRAIFARLLANGLMQAAAAFAVPICLADSGVGAGVLGPVGSAALLAAAGLALVWLRVAELTGAERLGQSFVAETRMARFDALLSGRTQSSHSVAMARLMNDLSALRNWVGLGLARGLIAVLSLVGAVAAAVVLGGGLALAVLAPVLAVLILAAMLAGPLGARVGDVRRVRGRLADRLGRALLRRDRQIARDGGIRARARVQRASDDLVAALIRRKSLVALLRAAPESVVPLAVAGSLVLDGTDLGAAHVGVVLLAGLAAGPLRVITRAVEYRIAHVVARDSLDPALTDPADAGAEGPDQPEPAASPARLPTSTPTGVFAAAPLSRGAATLGPFHLVAAQMPPDPGLPDLIVPPLPRRRATSARGAAA